MQVKIKGLKCDNPNCSWNNPDIPFEDYEKWLNAPCPLCGRPVLTQKDMNVVMAMIKMRDSKIIQGVEKVSQLFGTKEKIYRIEMDGTGKMDCREASTGDLKDAD